MQTRLMILKQPNRIVKDKKIAWRFRQKPDL